MMPDNSGLHSNAVSASSNLSPDNLQDAMWRLKIQDNKEGDDAHQKPYPDRPDEPDCIYYLRTGSCAYGSNCRYNHPAYTGQMRGAQYKGELPERVGQPDCQYFLKTGTCKFGATCKYHHPGDKHNARSVPLNILGLPIRQDEKSCTYYMRTGSCKFGIACKFSHPQPVPLGAAIPITGPSTYESPGSSVAHTSGVPLIGGLSAWPLSRPPSTPYPRMLGPQAYMPIVLPPSQGTLAVHQGWGTYMGTISHVPSTHVLGTAQMTNSEHISQLGSSATVNLPERPDQPECQFYMKTGRCKYGTSCKYHHPKERNSLAMCMVGPLGLPLRPGQAVCTFYSMYGSCKYGPACKFDHPLGYYNYSLPAHSISEPSVLFPNQRNSRMLLTSTETSPSKTSRLLVGLTKSESNTDTQDLESKAHGSPAQTTQSDTTLTPESPQDHYE